MKVYIERSTLFLHDDYMWYEGEVFPRKPSLHDDYVREYFPSLEDAVKWCGEKGLTDQKIYFEDPAFASVVVFLSPDVRRVTSDCLHGYTELTEEEALARLAEWRSRKAEYEARATASRSSGGDWFRPGLYRRD
jgi:hypothetical protein